MMCTYFSEILIRKTIIKCILITDWWIGDADTLTLLKQLKNNGNKLQISKCLFRVLLSKKEKGNAENCR